MSTSKKAGALVLLGAGYLLGRTRPVEAVREHLWRRIVLDAHGGAINASLPEPLRTAVGWSWLTAYGVAFPDQGWKLLTKKRSPARPVAEVSIGLNPKFFAAAAAPSSEWMCPFCGDHFGEDDDDVAPVCDMCRKAGRRAPGEQA